MKARILQIQLFLKKNMLSHATVIEVVGYIIIHAPNTTILYMGQFSLTIHHT